MTEETRQWHLEQVKLFNEKLGNREKVAETLAEVLNAVKSRTDPTAIVQARAKSLASFSEKVIRKQNKYANPLDQLTDLVGGRIITYTQAGAERVCQCIENLDRTGAGIKIDWDNSENTALRLRPEEFGYHAMHYVVQLVPPKVFDVAIDNWMSPQKMEIQVCTMMQHVWSAIGHDRIYKTQLKIDDSLKRRLSAISALIETAQNEFERGIADIDRYQQGFVPEMDLKAHQEAELIWGSVITVDPYCDDARMNFGDHYAALEQWERAFEQYERCRDDTPGIFAKRANAARRLGKLEEAEERYRKAAQENGRDWAVWCDLAELETERGQPQKALAHYQEAFQIASNEPRVLTGFVAGVVSQHQSLACTQALRGALDAAIEECKNRISLGIDVTNVFLQTARCYLLKGNRSSALDAYCKAGVKCISLRCLENEIAVVRQMQQYAGDRAHDFECVAALLSLLTVAVSRRLRAGGANPSTPLPELLDRDEEERRLKALATPQGNGNQDRPPYKKCPVVIVAGGCDRDVEERMKAYQATLQASFATFAGTLICGGTKAGISGLVGQVSRDRGDDVELVGYLPSDPPEEDGRDDENYRIYQVASNHGCYSPLGPIQTWADLLVAGVEPAKVRLLGINGGELSAFEFRLAMVMGATVGLVEDSGRAVSTLLTDPDWKRLGKAAKLPNEAETIIPFVCAFCPQLQAFAPDKREAIIEKLAQESHEAYRRKKHGDKFFVHQSILPWNELDGRYKESNRQQVAYADRILRTEGFEIVTLNDERREVELSDESHQQALWLMARQEHGRFMAERLADGWQYGPNRDIEKKTSPYLVPWQKLSKAAQEEDCEEFKELARSLKLLGLKIVKMNPD